MQFEVAAHRLVAEFKSPVRLEPLPYTVVRRLTDPAHRSLVDGNRSEVLTRTDGVDLALFNDSTTLGVLRRLHPEVEAALEPLVAGNT
jgi:peptide chain release factor 3